MPTPEDIAKAHSLLSSGNLSPEVEAKLRGIVGDPPEPEAGGGGENYHVTEMDPVKIEGEVPEEPEKGWWDGFGETMHDFGAAYSQAGLLGHGDELAGVRAKYELGGGEETAKYNRDRYRGMLKESRKRSPTASVLGDIAGYAGPGLLMAPLGAVAGGMAGGAIQGHGDSDEANPEETLMNMMVSAGTGAAIGELGQGVPELAKYVGTKLGGAATRLGSVADDYLMRATGMSAEEVRKVLGDKIKDYASKVRELGFDKGLPSARDMGGRAEKAAEKFRGEAEGITASLGEDAIVPSTHVSRPIRALKGKYAEGGYFGEPKRKLLDDIADTWDYDMPKSAQRMPTSSKPPPAAPVADRDMALRLDPEDIHYTEPKPADSSVPEWYEADFEEIPRGTAGELPPGPPPPEQISWKSGAQSVDDFMPEEAMALQEPDELMSVDDSLYGQVKPRQLPSGVASVRGDARFTDNGPIMSRSSSDLGEVRPEVQGNASFADDEITKRAPLPSDDTARYRYGIKFRDAQKERHGFGTNTNFASDDPVQQVRQNVYGAINSGMRRAADDIVPGSGPALRNSNYNEHVSILVRDAARKKALQETNNLRMPFAVGGGAALGAGAGLLTGGPMGAIKGGGLGAMLTGGLMKTAQGREHIIGSKVAGAAAPYVQKAANAFTGAGNALDHAVTPASIAGASRGGASLGTATAQALREDQSQTSRRVQDEARGYLQPKAIQQMLQSEPDSLAPFLSDFQEAAAKNDPKAWDALLLRLDRNPAFVNGPKNRILELTKGQR